jgi:hypothetical protein
MSTRHALLAPAARILAELREGRLTAAQASAQWRALDATLAQLPPRFAEVLGQLLDRLESSALFDGESCSFSARDLHDSLQWWIDKAEAHLDAAQEPRPQT